MKKQDLGNVGIIKKGNHGIFPRIDKIGINSLREFTFTMSFDTSCYYDLGDNDNLDWNKGLGVSWNLLTNHKDSVMIAWRRSKSNIPYYLDIGIYSHQEGKTVHPKKWVTVDISESHKVILRILPTNVNKVTASLVVSKWEEFTEYILEELELDSNINSWRIINPWFGGNRSAPHLMKFYNLSVETKKINLNMGKKRKEVESSEVPNQDVYEFSTVAARYLASGNEVITNIDLTDKSRVVETMMRLESTVESQAVEISDLTCRISKSVAIIAERFDGDGIDDINLPKKIDVMWVLFNLSAAVKMIRAVVMSLTKPCVDED